MKLLVAVFALILSGFNAFSDEPDLVEGARRAAVYWDSLLGRCEGNQGQLDGWYGRFPDGNIQMVLELRIHFKTEELSRAERLNGYEFKAWTSIEPGPQRWWIARDDVWTDWRVGEIAPPVLLVKKKGIWSREPAPNRTDREMKPLSSCAQIPVMEDDGR